MAQGKRSINLIELLLKYIGKPDTMLNMQEFHCDQFHGGGKYPSNWERERTNIVRYGKDIGAVTGPDV